MILTLSLRLAMVIKRLNIVLKVLSLRCDLYIFLRICGVHHTRLTVICCQYAPSCVGILPSLRHSGLDVKEVCCGNVLEVLCSVRNYIVLRGLRLSSFCRFTFFC